MEKQSRFRAIPESRAASPGAVIMSLTGKPYETHMKAV